MRGTWWTLAAVAVLTASVSRAEPKLELEVGAGALSVASVSPALSARVGVDLWNWFTPSVRVVSLSPWSTESGAMAVLGEARAHTQGSVFQLDGGLGVGLANARFFPNAAGNTDATAFRVAPSFFADVGARVFLGPVWLGANLGGSPLSMQWTASLNLGVRLFGD